MTLALLNDKFIENKLPPLNELSSLRIYKKQISLQAHPDYDVTPYGSHVYALNELVNLSDEFKYIFYVEMTDYGYLDENEIYHTEISSCGDGSITYEIKNIHYRESSIEFKGSINGEHYDYLPVMADIKIIGLSIADSQEINLYQKLLLEGYLLELEKSYEMSFFSYFTAIESFISDRLEDLKPNIYLELHDALEYLKLDEKIRILARKKESNNETDFNKIKIWGDFIGLLKNLKEIRNNIAHGKNKNIIKHDDVTKCFMCVAILISFYDYDKKLFSEIKKLLFPK